MATMQRERRRTLSSSSTTTTMSLQNEQQSHSNTTTIQQSNLDELAMQQLMLEPVEYEESSMTTTESPSVAATIKSLQNLNNVCLTGLDGVLRHILLHETTISSSTSLQLHTSTNVMSSIDYTTQHLARATTAMLSFNTTGNSNNSNENSNMNENHHNLTTLLSQVEKLLDHHVWLISSQTDLCRTLLHILHTIHKNGLLFNNNDKEDHAGHDHLIPFHNHPHLLQHVYTEIRQALASFPSQLTLEDGKKIKEIEAEFYQHLETLSRLVNHSVDPLNEEHPPAYQEVTHTFHGNKQGDFVPSAAMIKEEKPPQYQPNEPSTTCSEELDAVFQAIDRLSHVTPQFNNQRVERQLRIEPRHPATPKMLCDSIAQIQRVSRFKLLKRSNSAPSTTSKKSTVTTQRRVSATSTTRTTTRSDQVIETNHNNRHSLYEMTDLLVKSLHRPCFNKQRYQLTADKERDLFMNGLFNKVDRLEGRRLSNQDAEQPTSRLDELDQILNHICRSKQVQFENQRATFTVHST